MRLVHLTASTHFGGPERQMLGLAEHLPEEINSSFLSFAEGGRCTDFLQVARQRGFDALELRHDTPRLLACIEEITRTLQERSASLLFCHGYKSNLLGRIAARRAGIPAVAVSRGWTSADWKVRVYEMLDRFHLRFMDHVVCVSQGQARKVLKCGVPEARITVIRNSSRTADFARFDPEIRRELLAQFHGDEPVNQIVIAAGRLSPEKGFSVLIDAAATFINHYPQTGLLIYGDGPERELLQRRIQELNLQSRVLLPGFCHHLDRVLPAADLLVLPSFTEGLPNVVLEASAAGIPVVATAVGGTPEAVRDGETGYLVPAGHVAQLAQRIQDLLADSTLRQRIGQAGREFVLQEFSFQSQAAGYLELLENMLPRPVFHAV